MIIEIFQNNDRIDDQNKLDSFIQNLIDIKGNTKMYK